MIASYSVSLFVVGNTNLTAYSYFSLFVETKINLAFGFFYVEYPSA